MGRSAFISLILAFMGRALGVRIMYSICSGKGAMGSVDVISAVFADVFSISL